MARPSLDTAVLSRDSVTYRFATGVTGNVIPHTCTCHMINARGHVITHA